MTSLTSENLNTAISNAKQDFHEIAGTVNLPLFMQWMYDEWGIHVRRVPIASTTFGIDVSTAQRWAWEVKEILDEEKAVMFKLKYA